jgi:UDPglucose 6-dehydrogenase
MAELGHEVIGVDTDLDKVAALSDGDIQFYEPGLRDMLRRHLVEGRLAFTADVADVANFADVHFLCVGTPQQSEGLAADLTDVEDALRTLAPLIERPCLIVGKSTVPVGTAADLAAMVSDLAPAGASVELAWNPEFLREGHAIAGTLAPDRLVFGVSSEKAPRLLREVYAAVIDGGVPVVMTDLPTAELVKTSANAFLATKISFINAVAEICEATGADVVKLAEAIGHDPRIGRGFLRAGLGYGGGCLPKDIRAFIHRAGELGVPDAVRLLHEVDAINERRRQHVVTTALSTLTDLPRGRVAVLGAAFKPDSDDIRDSPALYVAGQLHLAGNDVVVYDPKAMDNSKTLYPTLGYADSAKDACVDADLVLHLTEWQEFRDLSPSELGDMVAHRRIIDARNCLDAESWRNEGWAFRGLGRP